MILNVLFGLYILNLKMILQLRILQKYLKWIYKKIMR